MHMQNAPTNIVGAFFHLLEQRKDNTVNQLVILADAIAEVSLSLEMIFFQHTDRCRVIGQHFSLNAHQVGFTECPLAQVSDCKGGNAAIPIGLSEPIAQFAIFTVHIVSKRQRNAARNLTVHLDCTHPSTVAMGTQCTVDKELCVLFGIRMRKYIAQVLCYLLVVCLLCQCRSVLRFPCTNLNLHLTFPFSIK